MENNTKSELDINIDEYALSFSDEFLPETLEKLQSVLNLGNKELKKHIVNVLIGNIPPQKVSENVGKEFLLKSFHIKKVTFRDSGKVGKYIILFGEKDGIPCSYSSSSEKIYEAVSKIVYVYSRAEDWEDGILVKIRMNMNDDVRAYGLEVV